MQSSELVSIGKKGVVEGEIFAKKLIISGKFVGKAECEHIEILKSGILNGDVLVVNLVIEEGAVFEGNCKKKDEVKNEKKLHPIK